MADDEQGRWDDLRDQVHGDLAQRLTAFDGSMLVKYVAMVEAIGDDGQRAMFSMCSKDTKPWESLGMMEHARHIEQAATSRDEDEP